MFSMGYAEKLRYLLHGNCRKIEMYASMRNAKICAIMLRLILEMREIARIAGTARGESHAQKNVGWGEIAAY